MERYESPTIEQVGGVGNHVEPQTVVPIVYLAAFLVLALYIAAAVIAAAAVNYTPVVNYNPSATPNYDEGINI